MADLTPKQVEALELYLLGATNEQIATKVRVSIGTISAWKKRLDFDKEAAKAQERLRSIIESHVFVRMRKSMQMVDEMMNAVLPDGHGGTVPDFETRREALKIVWATGTRLIARHKDIDVKGYIPPPIIVMPPGTRISTVRTLPEIPGTPRTAPVIEAEGHVVDDQDEDASAHR